MFVIRWCVTGVNYKPVLKIKRLNLADIVNNVFKLVINLAKLNKYRF